MDLTVLVITFGAIFIVELPDKTFIAALVLSTRYNHWAVWIGVGVAFGVQTLVAVLAGRLVTLLPGDLIHAISIAIFLLSAVILLRTAANADADEKEQEEQYAAKAVEPKSFFKATSFSFLVLFAAEWGDLSQLLTINLVARFHDHVSVFVGAWAALLTVSALAVLAGRVLLRYMKLSLLHYIGSAVCIALAAYTAYDLLLA